MSFPIGYFHRAWNVKAKTQQRNKKAGEEIQSLSLPIWKMCLEFHLLLSAVNWCHVHFRLTELFNLEGKSRKNVNYLQDSYLNPAQKRSRENWRKVRLAVPCSTLPSVRHILFHLPALSCHLPVWSNWQMCLQKSFKCAQEGLPRRLILIGNFALL